MESDIVTPPTEVGVAELGLAGLDNLQLRVALDASSDAVLITDATGSIKYVNAAFLRVTGYSASEVLGKTPGMLKSGVHGAEFYHQMWGTLRSNRVWRGRITNRRKDGTLYISEESITPVLNSAGQTTHYIAVENDITSRQRSEWLELDRTRVLEMIATSQPIETVLNGIVSLIERQCSGGHAWIMAFHDGRMSHVGPGLPSQFLLEMKGREVGLAAQLSPAALERGNFLIIESIATDPLWEGYAQTALRHGLSACCVTPVISSTGDALGLLSFFPDGSAGMSGLEEYALRRAADLAAIAIDVVRQRENSAYIIQHDPQIGLPNRIMYEERLERAIRAARGNTQAPHVGLLFLDFDRFKHLNDTYGHPAADAFLVQAAQRMQEVLRPADTIARFGGDEFVVVLPELTDRQQAVRAATQLLDLLKQPFVLNGVEILAGMSVGIAVYPQDGSDLQALQKNADTAMYRAKSNGGNQFACFAPEMHQMAAEKLAMEKDLRHAIDHGKLELHYQIKAQTIKAAA